MNMHYGRTLAVALALAALPAAVQAGDAKLGAIEIQKAWGRASAGPARAGAAFMTIVNGGAGDRLVAASAKVAQTTELHTHVRDGEVMRMRQIEAIDLPAGQTVQLAPGGHHVMFINLNEPLAQGAKFPLTLKFEKAGEVSVEVEVLGPGAMGPAMGAGMPAMPMRHGHGH